MMYPQGPQLNTQGFPELFGGGGGGGGGGRFVRRSELLQDGKVFLKTNYAGWKLVMPNVSSSVYKSISVLGTSQWQFITFGCKLKNCQDFSGTVHWPQSKSHERKLHLVALKIRLEAHILVLSAAAVAAEVAAEVAAAAAAEVAATVSAESVTAALPARYFLKPIMQDGSWLCQTCQVPFISQYLA